MIPLRDRICSALQLQPMSIAELSRCLSARRQNVTPHIGVLLARKTIHRAEVQRGWHPSRYAL